MTYSQLIGCPQTGSMQLDLIFNTTPSCRSATMHCARTFIFAQLSAAVMIELGLESQPPPKWLFLTMLSKMYSPTKIDVLGTWQD